MKRFLIFAAIAVIACSSVVPAQEQEPKLKPTVSPRTDTRKDLLLEIIYNRNLTPGYCTVDGPNEKPHWIWVTRFARIPNHQLQHREMPIWAVKLEAVYNGETADVRLTVLRRAKDIQKEDLVETYQVGVDEEKTLDELTSLGIEPFTIKLLAAVPPVPPPPGFNNPTAAIQIVKVDSQNMPRPAYLITFRNLSEKSVSALQVELTTDGRQGVSSMFQGEEGRALIEPGGTSEQYITVMPHGRITQPSTSNIINIRSVVFSDLSFEGSMETACSLETFVMGRRLWLRNVVSLMDRELPTLSADHVEAAKQFKEKFSALGYDLTERERNQASVVSPKCGQPWQRASVAPQTLKLQMLRDLDRIINTRPSPPVNFKSWLEERRTRYQAWLARLN